MSSDAVWALLRRLLELDWWIEFAVRWLGTKWAEIVGVAIGTVFLGIFAWFGLKKWVLSEGKRAIERRKVAQMPVGSFNIVVADLVRDDDGAQTDHIVQSLQAQFGAAEIKAPVRVQRCHQLLKPPARPEDIESARADGRAILHRLGGTVLVWGEVGARDQVLRLRFLSAGDDGQAAAKGYRLDDVKELPDGFGADLGAVLMTEVATSVASAYESGRYVANLLRPAVARLAPLVERPPAAFTAAQRGQLLVSYADALSVIGEQGGDAADLERAVTAYRAAQEVFTTVPLVWAITCDRLGLALWRLGQREQGTASLSESVKAFRSALEAQTRATVPFAWARTQSNLGNALTALGEREDSTQHLTEAVVAFRASLEVRTHATVPLDWAMTQNNLGYALIRLGERHDGVGWLVEAVAACRAALEVHTRATVPFDWARTQGNLGHALLRLGVSEECTTRLTEAVTACRAALEVYTRETMPLAWATTQSVLGSALSSLGRREESTARLEEAVNAYRSALEAHTRATVPLAWAMTQHSLATTLTEIGIRSRDCAPVHEAIRAATEARDVFCGAGAGNYLAAAEKNLEIIFEMARAMGCPPPAAAAV